MLILGVIVAAAGVLGFGVYTIGPTERGVISSFGRVQRVRDELISDDPELGQLLSDEEKRRYDYPVIRVIKPGGPYFKWPWQNLRKVDITIQTTDITWDPDIDQESIESVTKDNLTVEITGQIRWRPCERNLYPYLFAVASPKAHIMGYFISVLRDRIATFSNDGGDDSIEQVEGISINDLRKNVSTINQFMEESCRKTAARYGIELDAALITTIDPPSEVDEALASINTTSNNVAAEISQSKAEADQTLKMAEQAVQISENQANAEAAPLLELSETLTGMYENGGREALDTYLRNASLPLREKASQIILTLD
ncbi:MAG: SPFH domain-containing protein [Opitutaceae bacterium]